MASAELPARNPVARSLALAVLAVALAGAAIMGAVVFAVLLGIFALSIIPMIGLVGAAVDYSNANSVKAAMQAASDATALMMAMRRP